jgi:hypothetical protein
MPYLRLVLLIVSLLLGPLAEASDNPSTAGTWPTAVGQTRLSLPIPDGYSEATSVAPSLRQIGERLTPPINRLLGYFVDKGEIRALRPEAGSGLKRYFLVQTFRQTETVDISPAEFSQVKDVIRGQYKQMLPESAQTMQQQIDSTVQELQASTGTALTGLRIGEIRGLEVFLDESQAISVLAITKIAVQTQDATVETPMAVGMNTALIGRKLVYFYAYTTYSGEEDLEWVRAQSKAWLAKAAELNR